MSSWANSFQYLAGRNAPATAPRASGKSLKLPANPKVMFLGDSLTYGIGDATTEATGGYRQAVVQAFPTMQPYGGQANVNSTVLIGLGKEANEGHGGFTAGALDTPFVGYLAATGVTIDMIVLHCGTNGGANPGGQASTAAAVVSMYSKFMTHNPSGIFLVGCATGFPCYTTYPGDGSPYPNVYQALNVAFSVMRDAISGLPRVALADVGSSVLDSDIQSSDLLHPKSSGYAKMASGWITAISKLL